MIETILQVEISEKVRNLLGGEVEFADGYWHFQKLRKVKAQESVDLFVNWSLDLSVTYKLSVDNQKAFNQAEVFLLHEELSMFVNEMIKHPNFFPSSYSQQLTLERGMYCLRITSLESPKLFAERLSDSLFALE